jgi:hypothetical protein
MHKNPYRQATNFSLTPNTGGLVHLIHQISVSHEFLMSYQTADLCEDHSPSQQLWFVVGICLTQVGPTGCGFTLDFASG